MKARLAVVAALALGPLLPLPAGSEEVEAMLRDGRYREAYEATRAQEGEPAEQLRQAARAVLGTAMESPDSYTRWFALRAAQPLDDPTLVPCAKEAFSRGDRYEKSLALDVLVRVDPAGSREQLLEALSSPHRSIRLRALKGLSTLKDPSLAPRFAEILANESDPDLRVFAVRALAETGSPLAPAALYGALNDDVPAVSEESVQALVALKSPGVTGVLRRMLGAATPEDRVRVIRIASFARKPELIADLGPFIGDSDPEVRAYAAGAILAIAARAAQP